VQKRKLAHNCLCQNFSEGWSTRRTTRM